LELALFPCFLSYSSAEEGLLHREPERSRADSAMRRGPGGTRAIRATGSRYDAAYGAVGLTFRDNVAATYREVDTAEY